jgi:hypothetical protein
VIYLYAITGAGLDRLDGRGLQDAPLHSVVIGELVAIYSTHDRLDVLPDADSCWAHEQAVESVMEHRGVLPARFGTTFADLSELCAAVARQSSLLKERLDEVDGCVELAVRINPLTPQDGHTASSRQYLQDKLSAQRQREALAESALACLREFAVASCLTSSQSGEESVSISYLVKAAGVDRFSRAVGRLQRRWPEFALSCTGPWAPYSFVTNHTGSRA